MGNIFIDNCKNEKEKELLEKFFNEIKQLSVDMDSLSYAKYQERYSEAFKTVHQMSEKFGSYYSFNTFSLDNKARERYKGEYEIRTYTIPCGDIKNTWFSKMKTKFYKWFHSLTGKTLGYELRDVMGSNPSGTTNN